MSAQGALKATIEQIVADLFEGGRLTELEQRIGSLEDEVTALKEQVAALAPKGVRNTASYDKPVRGTAARAGSAAAKGTAIE